MTRHALLSFALLVGCSSQSEAPVITAEAMVPAPLAVASASAPALVSAPSATSALANSEVRFDPDLLVPPGEMTLEELSAWARAQGSGRPAEPASTKLLPGAVVLSDGLDPAEVELTIKRARRFFVRCRAEHPDAIGDVTVHATIAADGWADEISATGSLAKDPIAECFAAVIANLEFPEPETPTAKLSKPFRILPSSDPTPGNPRFDPPR